MARRCQGHEKHPEHYSTTKASDLYKGLAHRYERGETATYNWATLFDQNKTTGDFRQPETLTAHLRGDASLPNLQRVSLAEKTKRQTSGFNSIESWKKGPDRNAYIAAIRSMRDDKTAYAAFVTPDDYQPRARLHGEQPPTGVGYGAIPPIVKGSLK